MNRQRIASLALVTLLSAMGFMPEWAVAADSTEADTQAITAAIERWNEGWRTKDAKLAASAYSDDADWTNAFGFHERGREAITSHLHQVFKLPYVMAATSRIAGQEIRFLSDDVAIVRTRVERTGQATPDGRPLGPRSTHHLRVFAKHGDQWVIVSHLISDARDVGAPQH